MRRAFVTCSRVLALSLFALVLDHASAALPAAASAGHPDCDGAATDHVAERAAPNGRAERQQPLPASAVWMDPAHLVWGGRTAGAGLRYRLHHAATGHLHVRVGERVRGADGALELQVLTSGLPQRLATAFRHVGAGLTLRPGRLSTPALRALLRQQLVLTEEDHLGRVQAATRLQLPGVLDALYERAEQLDDLGSQVRTQAGVTSTRFRLWAPTATRVWLCLYRSQDGVASERLPLRRDDATGSWTLRQRGSLHGRAYAYLVDVVVPGYGQVRNRVTDPYSLALTPDSQHSVVVDLQAPDTQPPGWAAAPRPPPAASPTDAVIYELHVRDFSIGDASVPAPLRGRYGAFGLNDSNGVRHLKALASAGLTDVHLLPVFDLASIPERDCVTPEIPAAPPDSELQQAAAGRTRATDCFNWGYDPWHYTAPEGSYATPGASGIQRIVEFRRMVQALHALGLRVGMDVVYNHTSASGQHPQSVLDRIVPGYYHRLNANGDVERSTCCDNTATEHRMMAKLMIDSAVVWARDHRIDAFRFDLMGHQPRAAMEVLQRTVDRAAGRPIQLIGEGWNFGEVADGARFVQASQLSLNGSGIGTFNDRLRDAVRGGGAGDGGIEQILNQGYVSGLHVDRNPQAAAAGRGTRDDLLRAADIVRAGLAGSLRRYELHTRSGERLPLERIPYGGNQPAGYVSQPGEVVNYVENHDNQTLFDNLVFKLPPATSPAERARVQTLANALLLLSQGVAYVHAGQELLRSKSMDRNSYDSGDAFNRIDWTAQDNHFGTGLPPREDNLSSWPLMQPLLARAAEIKPRPEDIAFARDAFLDLLRIRSGTTLLRLRTAEDIQTRLRFHNTGPEQLPTLIVGHVDGRGYAGARYTELVYLVNVEAREQSLTLETLKGRPWTLHPVQANAAAADPRAAAARVEPEIGRFHVPARTAVVFVVE